MYIIRNSIESLPHAAPNVPMSTLPTGISFAIPNVMVEPQGIPEPE
jgi:hypothetical protein